MAPQLDTQLDNDLISLGSDLSGRMHSENQRMTDDYDLTDKILGEGVSGSVNLTTSKATGVEFAVKKMQLSGVAADKKANMLREVDVLSSMDHPHVTRLIDVYESEEELSLVMECLKGGDLYDKITEKGTLSEKDAAFAVWQMLIAMQYVHNQGVVHRDLKLEHFMYESKESAHLKLIDFGLSMRWQQDGNMDQLVGTLAYAAPEVLKKSYTSQCDVWSLGCIAFTLLLGYMPFPTQASKENLQKVMNGEYRTKDGMWDTISEDAGDFLRTLLRVDPEERPTMRAALDHPWIACWQFEKKLSPARNVVEALQEFSEASDVMKSCMQVAAWSLTCEKEVEYRETFLALDTDKNGTLSLGDLKAHSAEEHHGETTRLFACLKSDANGEVQYSEFVAAMMLSMVAFNDPAIHAAFTRLSGYIGALFMNEVICRESKVCAAHPEKPTKPRKPSKLSRLRTAAKSYMGKASRKLSGKKKGASVNV
jgi:calcium-dependent protein kinase